MFSLSTDDIALALQTGSLNNFNPSFQYLYFFMKHKESSCPCAAVGSLTTCRRGNRHVMCASEWICTQVCIAACTETVRCTADDDDAGLLSVCGGSLSTRVAATVGSSSSSSTASAGDEALTGNGSLFSELQFDIILPCRNSRCRGRRVPAVT